MRILTLLSAAALASVAAPALAQDAPDAAEVAEAINACRAVTTANWIHLDKLADHDFHMAEKRGRSVSKRKIRGLYAKKGNGAFIIASPDELKEKQCVVSAALADTAAYGPLAQGVSGIIGMPNRQDGNAYFWDLDGQTIKIEPEGSADEPYARFTVTAN